MKTVRFLDEPKIHVMYTWIYASKAARRGEWEMAARDRERFRMRINKFSDVINPVLLKKLNKIKKM